MKVLAANKYYFVKGGAERYFFELNRILEARGHTVVPFAMQHEQNEPTEFAERFVSYEAFDESASSTVYINPGFDYIMDNGVALGFDMHYPLMGTNIMNAAWGLGLTVGWGN